MIRSFLTLPKYLGGSKIRPIHANIQITQVYLTFVQLCDRLLKEHTLKVIACLSENLSALLALLVGVIKTLISLRPSF
jgi:hypothetical protein